MLCNRTPVTFQDFSKFKPITGCDIKLTGHTCASYKLCELNISFPSRFIWINNLQTMQYTIIICLGHFVGITDLLKMQFIYLLWNMNQITLEYCFFNKKHNYIDCKSSFNILCTIAKERFELMPFKFNVINLPLLLHIICF